MTEKVLPMGGVNWEALGHDSTPSGPTALVSEDAVDFFGLRRAGGSSWLLAVDRTLCSGTGALFGGAAFGAAVAVLEAATGRELVWAVIQFVKHVRPPAELHLEVQEIVRGRRASQARLAAVLDGEQMWSVAATLGERDPDLADISWPTRPHVPSPQASPPRPMAERHRGAFMERVSARIALGWPEGGHASDGRSAVWGRIPGLTSGAATLAVFGDYVPFGLRQAIGEGHLSHSLDNTLRVLRPPRSGWVLADVAIHGVGGGYGYGRVHLWDEDGTLLATASQSFTCRPR
jgi:acyl-CoA thioesterase-2